MHTFLPMMFHRLRMMLAVMLCAASASLALGANPLPSGDGLAAKYPGDAGIENDPSVVFVENFETGTLQEIANRWTFSRHLNRMALVNDVREGSAGSRSLRMSATRQQQGVELWKTFPGEDEGWETIFLRFDVKFAEDYGANHHFVSLGATVDPPRMPMGGAGKRPQMHSSLTIEPPYRGSPPFENQSWMYYSYWPEMRSWQTEEGKPDGRRPNPYYGNFFRPKEPITSKRGEWITVEMMFKLNSNPEDPQNRDGEIAFWIDGKLGGHWAPGTPERGFWRRDYFNATGNPPPAALNLKFGPFEGFRYRHDPRVRINRLRLQNYVSGGTFDTIATAIEQGYPFNAQEATLYFNNVVMATEYIGPVKPIAP